MKKELQVCTFEQAKKLKEFKLLQHSYFAYTTEGSLVNRDMNKKELAMMSVATDFIPAYNVPELSVMLDAYVNDFYFDYKTKLWTIKTTDYSFGVQAQCYAHHLIHLLETNQTNAVAISHNLLCVS